MIAGKMLIRTNREPAMERISDAMTAWRKIQLWVGVTWHAAQKRISGWEHELHFKRKLKFDLHELTQRAAELILFMY